MVDPASLPAHPTIEQLCAVVVSTARQVRGKLLFVGWTADGLPAATQARDTLSEDAQASLSAYLSAGFRPRRVPFATLVPVTYLLTGPAIDFADTRELRAEDQIRYTVHDATGERREVALGELGVLGAIAYARQPWQSLRSAAGPEVAVNAVPLYTAFPTLPGAPPDTGLAMTFEPTIPDATNAPAFRSFVRHTLGRLLVLDESQPSKSRKGYLEAAGEIAGRTPEGGVAGLLVWLRRTGFIEFDDRWLRGLHSTGQRARGQMLRVLRALGMVDVSDALLDELIDPRPLYDIDPLELDRLIDLAERMYEAARASIG